MVFTVGVGLHWLSGEQIFVFVFVFKLEPKILCGLNDIQLDTWFIFAPPYVLMSSVLKHFYAIRKSSKDFSMKFSLGKVQMHVSLASPHRRIRTRERRPHDGIGGAAA